MKTISIRELHQRTGAWVRKAAELGSITVTERGRPVARLEAVEEHGRRNPFLSRKLRPGYKRLMGTLPGVTDTVDGVEGPRRAKPKETSYELQDLHIRARLGRPSGARADRHRAGATSGHDLLHHQCRFGKGG